MKCNKFLWWAAGANSWLCKKLKICLCDSNPDPVPPEPPIPPGPPQPPDPPDPPVTVKIDICTKSGKKATKICKAIGCVEKRTFPSGGAPHLDCPKHVIGELETPRKFVKHGIWDWLACIHSAWEPEDKTDVLENWFFKCREIFKRGVPIIEGFMFVDDGLPEHAHWKNKAPFLWDKTVGKYNLSKPSPRYWEIAEKLLRIIKLFNGPGKRYHFQPTFVMERYDERPFKLNVNGVTRLKSYEAIPFVKDYLRWWIDLSREVFGSKYNPYLKFANEFSHAGPADFTFNADFHRALQDVVLSYGIPVWCTTVDVSGSEGCAAGVNEWRLAEKDGKWHGYKPSEQLINRANPKQCVLMEKHGCGSVASFSYAFEVEQSQNFFTSGNVGYLASVDGGTHPPADGKGYHPGVFRWPNKTQWRQTCKTMCGMAVAKGKRITITWAAVDVFRKMIDGKKVFNLWIENPDFRMVDYGYLDIMIEEIDRAYGAP